ncbi:hypothetical protein ACFFX1_11075 [Dactylosporangium sucinum]|uniref:Phosphoadenosine phosphosulfate reductase n=1 Tax=Dactylosporangium sucinum TaxID=1424081 RepID=A0A917TH81_9ACTN|nr:hypothetical protein [Dactylosporangium sucinum]GGM22535.1 hypothetical protein GCM10007977_024620 [Dactylosporangium sucinum]
MGAVRPAATQQLTLWEEAPVDVRLTDFDVIVIFTSAGKDSVAMLVEITDRARHDGVLDRVVAVHADLGVMEWPGTMELAERQARQVGITRFEVVRRHRKPAADAPPGTKGEVEDLLGYALRWGYWPTPDAQWCTSDLKRTPADPLLRRLGNAVLDRDPQRTTPARLLLCYGMRAEESSRRKKMLPLQPYTRIAARNREAVKWLPLHRWSTEEVFARGDDAGVARHPAYALGQSRLVCAVHLPHAGRARPCRPGQPAAGAVLRPRRGHHRAQVPAGAAHGRRPRRGLYPDAA